MQNFILCVPACDPNPELPCIQTGSEVLASRSFGEGHFPLDFIGLVGLYILFHLGAYVSLIFRSRRM